ncbi:hypothetical protein QQS21_003173 [Conoideocrella luteorostrata]|uniref:Uncharacterized protein n=1 Tax=Conoideocrella luteorostrata TaxID=1105319 RepID=A0AAJ0CTZ0_9HYPO|nr:hypothetical protein QQS21_003173 [Conoideocrella luteorostrata]
MLKKSQALNLASETTGGDSAKAVLRTYPDFGTGEQVRLDYQYEILLRISGGKLGRAPASPRARVLDGLRELVNGPWNTVRFGLDSCPSCSREQHPESTVLGINFSLIQPADAPRNCQFLRRDVECEDWSFDSLFDYAHFGHVVSCFDSTKNVMRTMRDNMKPGGWIEFHDSGLHYTVADGTAPGSALEKWAQLVTRGAKLAGET